MRLAVVAVADVGRRDKEGKRVFRFRVEQSALLHLFDLPHALFAVAGRVGDYAYNNANESTHLLRYRSFL